MPDLIELERLPFEQAQRYWAGKFPVGYEEYKAMSDEAKSLAFSAAGHGTAQDLAIVYEAAGRAVAEGIVFEKFRKDIAKVVANTGWSRGRQELIYRNNVQTAYAVGRYDRQQQAKDFLPYLMYDAVNDRRTRDTHLAMDNRVYPIDDPVWDWWTPPNGHRCFPGYTLVLREAGWDYISNVNPGERVIGGSGDPKKVESVLVRPFKGDMIRIKIKGTCDIVTTPNHRVLTIGGWSRAEHVKAGDVLVRTGLQSMISGLSSEVVSPEFDGAPLDRFCSIGDFKEWATSNCLLNEVHEVSLFEFNGLVYNLTVADDKTYIVNGATVHNCRCSTRSVSKLEAERDGLEIKEGNTKDEKIEVERNGKKVKVPLKPDEGWAVNPAKTAWKPDLDKLPKPLAKEYLKRLEAWEQ